MFLVLSSRLSRPQGHSAARRIRSIEKSKDFTKIRTHSPSAYSIVPHPTTPPHASSHLLDKYNILLLVPPVLSLEYGTVRLDSERELRIWHSATRFRT
jgi:hypothetical protein